MKATFGNPNFNFLVYVKLTTRKIVISNSLQAYIKKYID